MDQDLEIVCMDIFHHVISQLTLHLRFMDIALDQFLFVPDSTSIECDSTYLYYHPISLMKNFKYHPEQVTRGYLHMVLHSVFRHQYLTFDGQHSLWDLACDIAVENMIEELQLDFLETDASQDKQREIQRLKEKLNVLTAHRIYHYLDASTNSDQRKLLSALFTYDDHNRWYHIRDVVGSNQQLFGDESKDDPTKSGNNRFDNASHDSDEPGESKEGKEEEASQDDLIKIIRSHKKWEQIAQRMQTDLETFSHDYADQTGSMIQSLERLHKEKYNYTAFLKRFMSSGEKQMINDDEFDYIFYTYGLQLYKNLPLIENLEYKETKAIKEFVIAIDTSASVSGKIVQKFLQKTYNIFQQKENFFSRFNIHIIQCDTHIQEDYKVTTLNEFETYIQNLEIKGLGGTDFRTVFTYVSELIAKKEFHQLEGLIYFTDGDGAYPKTKPDFKTAFLFLDSDHYQHAKVPPWAIRYILNEDEIIHTEVKHEH